MLRVEQVAGGLGIGRLLVGGRLCFAVGMQNGLLMELNTSDHKLWSPALDSWVPLPVDDLDATTPMPGLGWVVRCCVCGGGGEGLRIDVGDAPHFCPCRKPER